MREADPYQEERQFLVATLIERGIEDPATLAAMGQFPRHELVAPELWEDAYADRPLPIDFGQTISQPYIVAFMTEAARIRPGAKVLEVGTGSGYQTAILALAGARVFTIEIVSELAASARAALERLGITGVTYRIGDAFGGWPEEAPFDAIVVTSAPAVVPRALVAQLKDGGRLIIPVGDYEQFLERHTKQGREVLVERLLPVRFVAMQGEAEQGSES